MTQTLYATFNDSALAEKATGALLDYGVHKEDISLVAKNHTGENTYADQYTEHVSTDEDHTEKAAKMGLSTTTPGDAEAGAVKGAGIGLGVGVLAALASLLVPGVGLVAGGGALAIALAGAAGTTAAGAVAGGVTGYLKDQGVPDEAITKYQHAYENGTALLAVHVPSGKVDQLTVESILAKYQANEINTYAGVAS